MARLIREEIRKQIAEELLFGKLINGGEVEISVRNEKLRFSYHSAAPKTASNKRANNRVTGSAKEELT